MNYSNLTPFSISVLLFLVRVLLLSHLQVFKSPMLPLVRPGLFQRIPLALASMKRMSRYVGPQMTDMTIAKVCRLVEGGRIDCIPNTEATKLAGKKTMDMSVRMRTFWP